MSKRCTALFEGAFCGVGTLRCALSEGHDVYHQNGAMVWVLSDGWAEEESHEDHPSA
jgi:hypothetical protein